MKECTQCRQYKDQTEYHKDKTKPDGLYPVCKECRKEKSLKDYWENREDILKKSKERFSTPTYKAKKSAYDRDRYEKLRTQKLKREKERYKNNPAPIKERVKVWKKNNKDRSSAYNRARKLSFTFSLTSSQQEDIQAFYTLALKLNELTGISYHVDHIVPLKGKNICGLHVPWNLQILEASLNISKGNKYEPEDPSTLSICSLWK